MNGKGKILVAVAWATAAVLTAGPELARAGVLLQNGYWDAYTGDPSKSQPACGVSTSYGPTGNAGAWHLKFYLGTPYFVVQVMKPAWHFTANAVNIPVELGIDRLMLVRTTGIGMLSAPDHLPMVEFPIPNEMVDTFLNAFRDGRQMWIAWGPGATEPAWRAWLTGSRETVAAFSTCVQMTLRTSPPVSGNTQPYAGAPPSTATTPTKPYEGELPRWKGQPIGLDYRSPAAKSALQPKRDDGSI